MLYRPEACNKSVWRYGRGSKDVSLLRNRQKSTRKREDKVTKKQQVSVNSDQGIKELLQIMVQLRDPESGCPWDQEQDFASIAPYTIEEAYEVAEAIRLKDMDMLQDELGDLLFQVVYHARMAEEAGKFTFADVVTSISDKMTRRHPHVLGNVFGSESVESAGAQTEAWEQQKAKERADKAANGRKGSNGGHRTNGANRPDSAAESSSDQTAETVSALDDVPLALPALLRAGKLQKRAARVGFDWPNTAQVVAKIGEEMREIGEAIVAMAKERNADTERHATEELGDLLFACANLGRHLGFDPEAALRDGNAKFERRFRHMEEHLRKHNQHMENVPLAILEVLWQAAKESERDG
ncbi:MAG: nucleoside triphosphate pyrophosphohydrolase [Proteobacteria bacterium]|nr:nucleoside triphosphate pyrophosphohydrolase [Pseudomonadota bacterium]